MVLRLTAEGGLFLADVPKKYYFALQSTLTMTKMPSEHPLEQLREIRGLMERSSRFIGLSGLAGVSAGIAALLGAAAVYIYFGTWPFAHDRLYHLADAAALRWGIAYVPFLAVVGAVVLSVALAGGVYFTTRRARRKGLKIWDRLTRRLLINLASPLAAGGLFCLALLLRGQVAMIAPVTLLFYGMALLHASKYTLEDVRVLGLLEIALRQDQDRSRDHGVIIDVAGVRPIDGGRGLDDPGRGRLGHGRLARGHTRRERDDSRNQRSEVAPRGLRSMPARTSGSVAWMET